MFYDDIETTMADSDLQYQIITRDSEAKFELKQKEKTSEAWEYLEYGRKFKEEIA